MYGTTWFHTWRAIIFQYSTASVHDAFLRLFVELPIWGIQEHARSPGSEVIKLFFMLNSAEHEVFSADKYENANNSWHFHIY